MIYAKVYMEKKDGGGERMKLRNIKGMIYSEFFLSRFIKLKVKTKYKKSKLIEKGKVSFELQVNKLLKYHMGLMMSST